MKLNKQSCYLLIPMILMLIMGGFFTILYNDYSAFQRFFLIQRSAIIMGFDIALCLSYELREDIKKMISHCAMVSVSNLVAILLLYLICGRPEGQLNISTICIFLLLPFVVVFTLRIFLSILGKLNSFLGIQEKRTGLVYLPITEPLSLSEETPFFMTHCFTSIGLIFTWCLLLLQDAGVNARTMASIPFFLFCAVGSFLFHRSVNKREHRKR